MKFTSSDPPHEECAIFHVHIALVWKGKRTSGILNLWPWSLLPRVELLNQTYKGVKMNSFRKLRRLIFPLWPLCLNLTLLCQYSPNLPTLQHSSAFPFLPSFFFLNGWESEWVHMTSALPLHLEVTAQLIHVSWFSSSGRQGSARPFHRLGKEECFFFFFFQNSATALSASYFDFFDD